nr:Ig kappa-1 chain J5 region (b95 allotype) - rabbit [Oryctolagus cuniculus]
ITFGEETKLEIKR